MCGIAFVINYDTKTPIELNFIKELFTSIEYRGHDAAGYYFEREEGGDTIRRIGKHGLTATDFWDLTQNKSSFKTKQEKEWFKNYKITGKEKFIMLHTRAKTQGTPLINENNHPVFSQPSELCKGYVLVHNGFIYNQRIKNYPYRGEVDSEEIVAYIEAFGLTEGLSKLQGSIALIIKEIYDDKIYIYRTSNPLDLAWFKDDKILVGASLSSCIPHPKESWGLHNKLFKQNLTEATPSINSLYSISLTEPKIELVSIIKEKKDSLHKWSSRFYDNFNRTNEKYYRDYRN